MLYEACAPLCCAGICISTARAAERRACLAAEKHLRPLHSTAGLGKLCTLPLIQPAAACSAPKKQRLDNFQIVKYPLTTESAMKKIEDNNTLVGFMLAAQHACS